MSDRVSQAGLRERIVLAMYPASTGGRGHAEALEKADRIIAALDDAPQRLAKAEKLLREIRDGKHSIPGCMVQIDRYFAGKGPTEL